MGVLCAMPLDCVGFWGDVLGAQITPSLPNTLSRMISLGRRLSCRALPSFVFLWLGYHLLLGQQMGLKLSSQADSRAFRRRENPRHMSMRQLDPLAQCVSLQRLCAQALQALFRHTSRWSDFFCSSRCFQSHGFCVFWLGSSGWSPDAHTDYTA